MTRPQMNRLKLQILRALVHYRTWGITLEQMCARELISETEFREAWDEIKKESGRKTKEDILDWWTLDRQESEDEDGTVLTVNLVFDGGNLVGAKMKLVGPDEEV